MGNSTYDEAYGPRCPRGISWFYDWRTDEEYHRRTILPREASTVPSKMSTEALAPTPPQYELLRDYLEDSAEELSSPIPMDVLPMHGSGFSVCRGSGLSVTRPDVEQMPEAVWPPVYSCPFCGGGYTSVVQLRPWEDDPNGRRTA